MTETEHYETIDMPFYHNEIKPLLPDEVLDFHAHIWSKKHWKTVPFEDGSPGANYMVAATEYPVEQLLADSSRILPGKTYKAVCFGYPAPAADIGLTNNYTATAVENRNLFPLMLAGKGLSSAELLEKELIGKGFYGYKVFLNWFGDNYGNISIEDMLSEVEMKIADKYRLIVLLHVPQSGRLTDPVIQAGVKRLSGEYPEARIVLAHCGRCYLPDQMKNAVKAIKNLDNVYLDSSMVMEPLTLQILLEEIDSSRFVFGTDFPIPSMRGRRVYVMDHWVDLVLTGCEESAFRVQSDNFRASFMVYEIILAIRRAAERLKLSEKKLKEIFYENGMKLLETVTVPGCKIAPKPAK
ncbi:MAG: amidohydrolase family protein [Spirochaetota bacterium]